MMETNPFPNVLINLGFFFIFIFIFLPLLPSITPSEISIFRVAFRSCAQYVIWGTQQSFVVSKPAPSKTWRKKKTNTSQWTHACHLLALSKPVIDKSLFHGLSCVCLNDTKHPNTFSGQSQLQVLLQGRISQPDAQVLSYSSVIGSLSICLCLNFFLFKANFIRMLV